LTENTRDVGTRTVASVKLSTKLKNVYLILNSSVKTAQGAVIAAANIYATWSAQVCPCLIVIMRVEADIIFQKIYRADDAPLFRRGNTINIAFAAAALVLWLVQKAVYVRENAKLKEKWASLSAEEQQENEDQKLYFSH
jgi:hypothetical protein